LPGDRRLPYGIRLQMTGGRRLTGKHFFRRRTRGAVHQLLMNETEHLQR